MAVFDHRKAIWMWEFSAQSEQSYPEAATAAKNLAGADLLLVKVMDGADFMQLYDQGSPGSVDDWHAANAAIDAVGLPALPWVVPHGPGDAATHAALSSILMVDLEPYPGFWTADAGSIPAYLGALRDGGVQEIHVSIDPRPSAVQALDVATWASTADAIHPQVYWTDFQQDALEVMPMLRQLRNLTGKPIYPVLPGNGAAQDLADVWLLAQALGCPGVSVWRLGSMDQDQLAAFAALRFAPAPTLDLDAISAAIAGARGALDRIAQQLSAISGQP